MNKFAIGRTEALIKQKCFSVSFLFEKHAILGGYHMKKEEIDQILKDYHWMINSIKIMRESLKDAGEGLIANYGIEASLPKAQGTVSDPIFREVARRSKRWKKIHEYERKVFAIQELFYKVQEERESEVLYW